MTTVQIVPTLRRAYVAHGAAVRAEVLTDMFNGRGFYFAVFFRRAEAAAAD